MDARLSDKENLNFFQYKLSIQTKILKQFNFYAQIKPPLADLRCYTFPDTLFYLIAPTNTRLHWAQNSALVFEIVWDSCVSTKALQRPMCACGRCLDRKPLRTLLKIFLQNIEIAKFVHFTLYLSIKCKLPIPHLICSPKPW